MPPERTARAVKDPRELVSPEVFDLLVGDLRKYNHVTRVYAERTMGQGLVYLKAVANMIRDYRKDPDVGWARLVPTVPVDEAWHRFVLRSKPYTEWCDLHAGRFIHHQPYQDGAMLSGDALEWTLPWLIKTGCFVDMEFWHDERQPCCPPECSEPGGG